MSLAEESQKLAQDAKITLWRMDLSAFGDQPALFTTHVLPDGSPVEFDGDTYVAVEAEAEGFAWSGDGQQATPVIRVPRSSVTLSSLLRQYDQLRGVLVERVQTYRMHLDDGDDPDPSATWPVEVWAVDRVSKPRDADHYEIELATPIDQSAAQIPGRMVARDYCGFGYRIWDAEAEEFDYSGVFCPYAGAAMFDVDGNAVTDPADDVCGKQLRDCEIRHAGVKVPFGGFPGVARVRA